MYLRRLFPSIILILASQNASAETTEPSCESEEWPLQKCGNTCLRLDGTEEGTQCAGCVDNECVELPATEGGFCAPELAFYCGPSYSDNSCGDVFCEEGEYCLDNSCIPHVFDCGNNSCDNTRSTVCALESSTCVEFNDLCSGRELETKCLDDTQYKTSPVRDQGDGPMSAIEVCQISPLDVCDSYTNNVSGGGNEEKVSGGVSHGFFLAVVSALLACAVRIA